MMYIKTVIKYNWENREAYYKAEKQLLEEGWEKINWTQPSDINIVDQKDKFVSVFGRTIKN